MGDSIVARDDGDRAVLLTSIKQDDNAEAKATPPDEETAETTKCSKGKIAKKLKANLMVLLVISGAILGLVVGVIVRSTNPSSRTIMLVDFPGQLLLRMLQMLIVPLLVSSLIAGVAQLDVSSSRRLGIQAIIYYFTTTVFASILGIVLVLSIRPGYHTGDGCVRIEKRDNGDVILDLNVLDSLLDLIRNMFPKNLIEASFRSERSHNANATYVERCSNNKSQGNESIRLSFFTEKQDGMNVLGLIVFSIAFGLTISKMGLEGRPLKIFFVSLNEAIMRLVGIVIWYSPLGILFLIAAKVADVPDVGALLTTIGFYMMTVLLGLAIHAFIVLPLVYFLLTRKNPYSLMIGVFPAMAFAFGTSSSAATLPVTLQCLEERCGVDKMVSRFVLPVGATVNMDGTCLYEAVAAIFIAQYNRVSLNLGKVITISLTATAASIGAAAVPSAGLYTMIIVLTAVRLPLEDITLLVVVDWFLDRFRTPVNVLGDSFGAAILQHFYRKRLQRAEAAVLSSEEGVSSQEHRSFSRRVSLPLRSLSVLCNHWSSFRFVLLLLNGQTLRFGLCNGHAWLECVFCFSLRYSKLSQSHANHLDDIRKVKTLKKEENRDSFFACFA